MKKLVCVKEVLALAQKGEKVMYIDSDTLITPSARDEAANAGIEFCEGEAPCCTAAASSGCNASAGGVDSEVIYSALKTLMEKGMLGQVMSAVGQDVPYISEGNAEGTVKLVRSGTAKWLPLFEDGDLVDKVFYNELIGAADGSSMNAGFITIDRCSFPWETACQELYYVVEGTLVIGDGTREFVANAGDCLFFENGKSLTFGSPNKMKAFYATH